MQREDQWWWWEESCGKQTQGGRGPTGRNGVWVGPHGLYSGWGCRGTGGSAHQVQAQHSGPRWTPTATPSLYHRFDRWSPLLLPSTPSLSISWSWFMAANFQIDSSKFVSTSLHVTLSQFTWWIMYPHTLPIFVSTPFFRQTIVTYSGRENKPMLYYFGP
jgi:hypothetical protein